MLIPSKKIDVNALLSSLSRRVNANSQLEIQREHAQHKLIKKGEC